MSIWEFLLSLFKSKECECDDTELIECQRQLQKDKKLLEEKDLLLVNLEDSLKKCNSRIKRMEREIDILEEEAEPEPFPDIPFEPAFGITQTWVDFAKQFIETAGMCFILRVAEVEAVRVVDDMTQYNVASSTYATIYGHDIILNGNAVWLPSFDLPGSILHEAAHLWALYNQCDVTNELFAYTIQQVYEWTLPNGRNLFKERVGAIGLL